MSLANDYPWISIILSGLGGIMVIAQIVVPLTPTKKDDQFLNWIMKGIPGKILRGLTSFAPIQKKEKSRKKK